MSRTSEYQLPIFISSTEYNLMDLRAELTRFLSQCGYRPVLSSAEGFHDNGPDLQPWESCLGVMKQCHLMVLIIDGRYGEKLSWPAFEKIVGREKISPTHAEYRFAHKTNMRMLVFVRRGLFEHYQAYRRASKRVEEGATGALDAFDANLPAHVQADTMRFLEEVKTSAPIPWIKEFTNVVDLKREVKKKLLNELAELFLMQRGRDLQALINIFGRAIAALTEDERGRLFKEIAPLSTLVTALRASEAREAQLQGQLSEAKGRLNKAEAQAAEGGTKNVEIAALREEVKQKEAEASYVLTTNFDKLLEQVLSSSSGQENPWQKAFLVPGNVEEIFNRSVRDWALSGGPSCDGCGSPGISIAAPFQQCANCKRQYCDRCRSQYFPLRLDTNVPNCNQCSQVS
jgi:hypothetical protein